MLRLLWIYCAEGTIGTCYSHYSGSLDTHIYGTSEYKGTNRNSNAYKFEMFLTKYK